MINFSFFLDQPKSDRFDSFPTDLKSNKIPIKFFFFQIGSKSLLKRFGKEFIHSYCCLFKENQYGLLTGRNLGPSKPAIGWRKVNKPCQSITVLVYLPSTNSRAAWYKVSTCRKTLWSISPVPTNLVKVASELIQGRRQSVVQNSTFQTGRHG